jgi:protein-tyrosine phosphatase
VHVAEIAGRVAALQRAVDAEGLRVRLHPGGEVAHEDALALHRGELELVAQGPAGGRWILLEAPFAGFGDAFVAAFERLTAFGYGVVIAHPERAAGGHERLDALRSAGALLQVNVCSLLGNHGLDVQEIATSYVRSGLAFCLASDGHPGTRDHTLQLGFHLLLLAGASSVQAWRLTQGNPRFLLRSGVSSLRLDELAVA